jgi:hypothetical protein
MIYILFFGGLCAYFVLVSRYGSLGSFLARRQGAEPTFGIGVADVETLRNAVVLSALAAFAATLSAKKHMRMFLLIFVIALVLSVAAGGRSDVIFPLFSLLMMDHYLRKPKKLRHFVVLGLITAMVISPLMIIFRDGLRPSEVAWTSDEVSGRGGVTAFMERMGGVESLTIIIRDTPDVMNYQYGATLAYIFVAWVPRYLWVLRPQSLEKRM